MTCKCAEITSENWARLHSRIAELERVLDSNRLFFEEIVTAGGKHSDINCTSVIAPAYEQLTATERILGDPNLELEDDMPTEMLAALKGGGE